MANSERSSRIRNRKKKKKRVSMLFWVLLLVFLGLAAYFYYEYKKGMENSLGEANLQKQEIEFNGVEDKNGKVNILLLGVDSRGEEVSRTDTIMIAQYDPDSKESKLVSIMRDSYVDIPQHDKNKINAAYAFGGTELLRQTIKENFDVNLQYYALIDFRGFAKMVDTAFPEGITVDVPKRMSEGIDVTLNPGRQKLHGKELLGYVRFRQDAQSDFGRVERQQEVIKSIADEVLSVQGVVKIPGMLGTIQPYISTNMKKTTTLSIISTYFLKQNGNEIKTLRIPVDNSFQNRSYPHAGSVLEMDIDENRRALQEFLK
ncbi:LCP family protein [Peribacillus glennii]|uniref:Regulatory protein MsrR n=1 Tax=Peribacillus glennii TaxID=2303991 RepID=A0A372L9C8_9BACI|nr:LCP family protein [Peribacillus glennii]RFU61139.1 LytR family transcriptional regulator [Peribacillus glennii]